MSVTLPDGDGIGKGVFGVGRGVTLGGGGGMDSVEVILVGRIVGEGVFGLDCMSTSTVIQNTITKASITVIVRLMVTIQPLVIHRHKGFSQES
ncbi:MAG: hypothetical protein K8T10_16090, partial [Candidatus Eremiobacteraeota bacterium]|nr:hypothetical protein [Candidatus Eremiobacteraeota bacterium]